MEQFQLKSELKGKANKEGEMLECNKVQDLESVAFKGLFKNGSITSNNSECCVKISKLKDPFGLLITLSDLLKLH